MNPKLSLSRPRVTSSVTASVTASSSFADDFGELSLNPLFAKNVELDFARKIGTKLGHDVIRHRKLVKVLVLVRLDFRRLVVNLERKWLAKKIVEKNNNNPSHAICGSKI